MFSRSGLGNRAIEVASVCGYLYSSIHSPRLARLIWRKIGEQGDSIIACQRDCIKGLLDLFVDTRYLMIVVFVNDPTHIEHIAYKINPVETVVFH